MRIIAGTAGGRRLRAPHGAHTRPTADRVREALFNILVARGEVPERVLDLYAGSGALGLEALSRGARDAVFVEEDARTVELIRQNARDLGLQDACRVVGARVREWLRKSPPNFQFGWIFLDPPYASDELDRALELLDEAALLQPGGVAVAEHEWRTAPSERHGGLALSDRRRYGQTALSFFEEVA
jgi:16S rRNA (guanine(966)-N(2))-methyltransferase RsmD